MLYVIKRTRDFQYLSSYKEDNMESEFTPLQSDALQLPENIAKRYARALNKLNNDVYNVVSANKSKKI